MVRYRGSLVLFALLLGAPATTTFANVITDWDEIGVKTVQPVGMPPPINPGLTFRAMAMMHIAMFDAVNSIDSRYQPYKFQDKAVSETSPEAAAASAAANVLAGVVPKTDVRAMLANYLVTIPDGKMTVCPISGDENGTNMEQAIAVAKRLAYEGCNKIDLCSGFTMEDATKIQDALGDKSKIAVAVRVPPNR